MEGGSSNDYEYVGGDPVNGLDLDGRCWQAWQKRCRGHESIWAKGARLASNYATCGNGAICTASKYGTVTATGCFVACGSVAQSRANGADRVGVSGSICCRRLSR